MSWEKIIQEYCSYLWALKSPFICFAFVIFVFVLPECVLAFIHALHSSVLMSLLTAVTRNCLLLQKAEAIIGGCGHDTLVAIWCCGIISTSAFVFLHVFWCSLYSLRRIAYIHLHGLPHSVCGSMYTMSGGGTILCWVLSVHVHTQLGMPAPSSWHSYRCSFRSYFILGNLFGSFSWVFMLSYH